MPSWPSLIDLRQTAAEQDTRWPLLTGQDVHEDRGQLVDEQHDGMVGYGQQQKENNRGNARQGQGYACAEKVAKPDDRTQKAHVCLLVVNTGSTAASLGFCVFI